MSAGVQAASATVVYKGPSGSKQIALTFDDNGGSAHSVATLRALQANKVPASLFLIGSAVASTPNINTEIIKGMNAGLFEVGDHSWSHKVLTGLSTSALATEIGGGTDAFHSTTGARTVPLFRPPYGTTNSRVAAAAGAEGFNYLVLWDVDPRDWSGDSASSIANRVISHAHSGAIVVMHMSATHTAAAIPLIVKALRAKGYEFAKVSTMLKGDRLFLDVDAGSAQGAAIARMVERGFMNGYDGNYFGPVDTITRAQVAKVATEVGGIHTDEVENVDTPLFADVPAVRNSKGIYASYPFDYVQEAATAGLVLGSADAEGLNVFKPTADIKRLQLASILARMVRAVEGLRSADRAIRFRRHDHLNHRGARGWVDLHDRGGARRRVDPRLIPRRSRVRGRRRRPGGESRPDVGQLRSGVWFVGRGAARAGRPRYESLPRSGVVPAGRLTVTLSPPVSGASSSMVPFRAVTTDFTMERPRPNPPVLRLRDLSGR